MHSHVHFSLSEAADRVIDGDHQKQKPQWEINANFCPMKIMGSDHQELRRLSKRT